MTNTMQSNKFLFMVMLGCKPPGRLTEQHDVFFGIACNIEELVPSLKSFWPEAGDTLHIDAWRQVSAVEEFSIGVVEKINPKRPPDSDLKLYFINLGGYKSGEFDELHKRMLIVATDKSAAVKQAKNTFFYKDTGFDGAASHIDEKYGFDVDEIVGVDELLPPEVLSKYRLEFGKRSSTVDDAVRQGYIQLHRLHLPSE